MQTIVAGFEPLDSWSMIDIIKIKMIFFISILDFGFKIVFTKAGPRGRDLDNGRFSP